MMILCTRSTDACLAIGVQERMCFPRLSMLQERLIEALCDILHCVCYTGVGLGFV